jgi:hypothetical protein
MTGRLFLRRARVQVANIIVKYDSDASLRIKFRVSKNPFATEPNVAHIEVFNLNEARRGILDSLILPQTAVGPNPPIQVSIEAGYGSNVGAIFKGQLLSVAHSKQRGDVITKIIAASVLASDVPISGMLVGPNIGALTVDVLKQMAQGAARLDVKEAIQRALQGDMAGVEQQVNKAISFDGPAMTVLDNLIAPHGFQVSEQDNRIVIRKHGEVVGVSVKLNASSGLVGAIDPIKDTKRPGIFLIRARTLLRDSIEINTPVEMEGLAQKGLFVVESLEHQGDTHGGADSFITVFQARSALNRFA